MFDQIQISPTKKVFASPISLIKEDTLIAEKRKSGLCNLSLGRFKTFFPKEILPIFKHILSFYETDYLLGLSTRVYLSEVAGRFGIPEACSKQTTLLLTFNLKSEEVQKRVKYIAEVEDKFPVLLDTGGTTVSLLLKLNTVHFDGSADSDVYVDMMMSTNEIYSKLLNMNLVSASQTIH